MGLNNFFKLVIAIVVSALAGVVGSFFTTSAIPSWYSEIIKPVLNPPGWIFGPVWTALYILMGIAAYLVWKNGWEKSDVRTALGVFGIQLILNATWSIIFFGLQNPGAAFIEILSLWLTILATIIAFSKISRQAAWLLAPYIVWVTFAAYLNYSIWFLN
jgi:tryptophan-rich sensory protein